MFKGSWPSRLPGSPVSDVKGFIVNSRSLEHGFRTIGAGIPHPKPEALNPKPQAPSPNLRGDKKKALTSMVNPKKLATGLRTISAGIACTLLLGIEASGFLTLGLLL